MICNATDWATILMDKFPNTCSDISGGAVAPYYWREEIEATLDEIEQVLANSIVLKELKITQIKLKWSGLRIYISYSYKDYFYYLDPLEIDNSDLTSIYSKIDDVSRKVIHICKDCGEKDGNHDIRFCTITPLTKAD